MGTKKYFNGVKTFGLFAVMWAILLGLGAIVDGGNLMWVFAALGVIGTFVGYWNSDKLAIAAMHARPVTEVEQPTMYRIVRELSQKAGQPMPRLYVSPTEAPNAFATGRNPRNSAVCCTEGILDLLNERELRGVLGHELMHVYNRDVLIGSVAAAFAGMVTSLAYMAMWFGGNNRNGGGNPLALLGMLILAPLAATLVRASISRTREYDADEDGSELTGDPMALASALRKLESGVKQRPLAPQGHVEAMSHLFIANPFSGEGLGRLFSTHPPMDARVERLELMSSHRGFIR